MPRCRVSCVFNAHVRRSKDLRLLHSLVPYSIQHRVAEESLLAAKRRRFTLPAHSFGLPPQWPVFSPQTRHYKRC